MKRAQTPSFSAGWGFPSAPEPTFSTPMEGLEFFSNNKRKKMVDTLEETPNNLVGGRHVDRHSTSHSHADRLKGIGPVR